MKFVRRDCLAALLLVGISAGESPQRGGGGSYGESGNAVPPTYLPPASDPTVRAKLDHEQNLKDAARLALLATEVLRELETAGANATAMATVKKAGEMEKLARKLNGRLKRN